MDIEKRNKELTDSLIKHLQTPVDISKLSPEKQAQTIVLSFIGYVARPTGISKELLQKCVETFNENRGKVEKEIEAVLKVLENDGT